MKAAHEGGPSAGAPPSDWRTWAAIILVVAPGVTLGLTVTPLAPMLPAIAAHLGAGAHGKLLAQYLVAISGIGVMVGAPISGVIVDRAGLRPMLVGSSLLYTAAGLAGYLLDSSTALLFSRFILGFGAGAFAAAATALLGQRWHGSMRAHLLGGASVAGAVGGIITTMLAGVIGRTWGWHAPFLLYGITAPLALLSLTVTDKITREVSTVRGAAAWRDWLPILPILLASLPLYIVLFSPMTQLPLLLADVGLKDPGVRALILIVPVIASGTAALFFAHLYKTLGPSRLFVVLLALYGAGVAVMGLVNGPALAIVSCALCGLGMGLVPGHFNHVVLDESTPAIRGRAVAVLVATHYVAQFLNPVLIGTLGAFFGMRQALLAVGVLLLVWMVLAAPKALRRPAVAPAL